MKLFDFLQKAQEKANELQEKAESIATQIDTVSRNANRAIPNLQEIQSNEVKKHQKMVKKHTPKRGASIASISKQTIRQRDSMIRNGFKEYTFIANRDCCPVCRKLNGKHFPVSKLKIGVNAPPMHEGCKCSIAAYEDEKAYQAWLNSL